MTDLLEHFEFFSKSITAYKKAIKYFYIFVDSKHYKRYNILYVSHDYNVFGFGHNSYGVLGLAHDKKVKMPTEVDKLSFENIDQFHNGKRFVLAIPEHKKTILAMGKFKWTETITDETSKFRRAIKIHDFFSKPGEIITQVSCGYDHALILTSMNLVYGWGKNYYGQIGQVCILFLKKYLN